MDFQQVIQNLSLLTILQEFDPVVIGTPPLGIAIETSDIDVACLSNDLQRFRNLNSEEFGKFDGYLCRSAYLQERESVIVQFRASEWDIELFCQTIPTNEQWGVRHFRIEERILRIEPKLKVLIKQLKRDGLKTEPAFAAALGLSGDPYLTLLSLEALSDAELAGKIIKVVN